VREAIGTAAPLLKKTGKIYLFRQSQTVAKGLAKGEGLKKTMPSIQNSWQKTGVPLIDGCQGTPLLKNETPARDFQKKKKGRGEEETSGECGGSMDEKQTP